MAGVEWLDPTDSTLSSRLHKPLFAVSLPMVMISLPSPQFHRLCLCLQALMTRVAST